MRLFQMMYVYSRCIIIVIIIKFHCAYSFSLGRIVISPSPVHLLCQLTGRRIFPRSPWLRPCPPSHRSPSPPPRGCWNRYISQCRMQILPPGPTKRCRSAEDAFLCNACVIFFSSSANDGSQLWQVGRALHSSEPGCVLHLVATWKFFYSLHICYNN